MSDAHHRLELARRASAAAALALAAACHGDGPTPPQPAGDVPLTAVAVYAGDTHVCTLDALGRASCWGWNRFGQLGVGNGPEESAAPLDVAQGDVRFASLAVGAWHSCGLTAAGEAYCWGANGQGQMARAPEGDEDRTPVPVRIEGRWDAVAAGKYHSCGLRDGAVSCWGLNNVAQLGSRTLVRSATPVPVAGLPPMRTLASRGSHTCGASLGGAVYCWGFNDAGQLGIGTFSHDEPTPRPLVTDQALGTPVTGALHSCALSAAGAAYCWGINSHGELGNGEVQPPNAPVIDRPTPSAVAGGLVFTSLAAGADHSCGLTAGGQAYCWGWNGTGGLGAGPAPHSSAVPLAVAGGHRFAALGAGENFTCGVTVESRVYCWGENHFRQLGNESGLASDVPVLIVRRGS